MRSLLLTLLLTAAGAATAGDAARRPQSLFIPEAEESRVLPPLLPPATGIAVPNVVTQPFVRHTHLNPDAAKGLSYERPRPKSRAPVGRRGVPYPADDVAAADPVAPWDMKFAGGVRQSIDAITFDTNGALPDGGYFIPPDSNAAVSPDHIVTVTNVALQFRNRAGTLLGGTQSLKDFFDGLGAQSPDTSTFDPKVFWDEHAQRFVLVTLEQTEAPNPETSYIFLAVTTTTNPAGAWYMTRIDARRTLTVGGSPTSCWGDYPGFGFDEQAVYIALNMFAFSNGQFCDAALLWIVTKGTSGGFYQGGTAQVRQIDPYAGFGAIPLTTQVARMRGTQPSSSIGTFLVGFDSLSTGNTDADEERLQVARVDNPLTSTPDVVVKLFDINNIARSPSTPVVDAPQPVFAPIDAGDKRALDAVWRADRLYTTFIVNPPSGVDTDDATAHWVELDTTRMSQGGTPPVERQGNVGGEELSSQPVHTYYPSIDVNARGQVVIGFSASATNLHAGAYAVSRRASDANGVVSAPITIHAGVDPYLRTFGEGNPNRWGDYSSVSIDPNATALGCFWVYNQWAQTRGTSLGNEDGRWATTAAQVCVCDGNESSGDADFDGICNDQEVDLSITKTDNRTGVNAGTALSYVIVVTNLSEAVTGVGVSDTFPAPLTGCTWTCSASAGGSCPASGSGNINVSTVSVATAGTATFIASCNVPAGAPASTLSNTATVSHPFDAVASNNTAIDTTTVVPRADLSITKTDGATSIDAGAMVTYTIAVSNLTAAASAGTVNDTFAAPLTGCTWTCSAGAGSVCPTSGSGGISASISLAASGSVTFTARCTVAASASGTLSNTATVTGTNDPTTANNTATDSDTAIRPRADLSITKTDNVTFVNAGSNLVYTIVARNNGGAAITGATVTDTFAAPLTGCSWTCSASAGGTCAGGSGAALADTIALAAGGTATYTATCTVPAATLGGTISNSASVAYTNDPSQANNTATDGDTVVRPSANLAISKTDGSTSVDAGRPLTYTIVVTNPAAVAIPGATVTDTFPAALTACAWTCSASAGGSCGSATGTGNIADTITIGAGGSVTYVATCRVLMSATGTLSNNASVAYSNDPSSANNIATDGDTAIVPPLFADGFE